MKALGIPEQYKVNDNLYFDIQLIRRGKDHPNMPSANYTFKTYYVDSLENYDKYREEIVKCCDMFYLRAYVSVNAKSKREAALKTIQKYAENLTNGEFRKPWRVFSSVCGGQDGEEKRWIVDIDNHSEFEPFVLKVKSIIDMCAGVYEKNVITSLPTKSGCHIITHPFNLQQCQQLCKEYGIEPLDVKKNHITLLYENI